MKFNFKTIILTIALLSLPLSTYAQAGMSLGFKYGYSYVDELTKGKTYSTLLDFPINQIFNFEIEHGRYEDGKYLMKSKFTGAYVGVLLANIMDLPFKGKIGYIKESIDFKHLDSSFSKDFEDKSFSWGIGTGINMPYFNGYIEYLQISKKVHTISAKVRFS